MKFFLTFALLLSSLTANSADKVKFLLNWKPEPEFGGFYEAQISGKFKAKNLDVEITPGAAGMPVVQMVATGQMDIGITNGDMILLSRDKGTDVVALFAVYQNDPQGLMFHEERGFKSIEDVLKSDSTLLVQQGAPYVSYMKKKYAPIKATLAPYTGGVAQFVHDKKIVQQCYVTAEPAQARKLGAHPKTVLLAETGYNPYNTVVFTSKSFYDKNKKLVHDFLSAIRDGWNSYLKDPVATNAYMAKLNTSMDLETFAEAARIQKDLVLTTESKKHGVGKMSLKRWGTLIDQLQDLKLTTKKMNAKDVYLDL